MAAARRAWGFAAFAALQAAWMKEVSQANAKQTAWSRNNAHAHANHQNERRQNAEETAKRHAREQTENRWGWAGH